MKEAVVLSYQSVKACYSMMWTSYRDLSNNEVPRFTIKADWSDRCPCEFRRMQCPMTENLLLQPDRGFIRRYCVRRSFNLTLRVLL